MPGLTKNISDKARAQAWRAAAISNYQLSCFSINRAQVKIFVFVVGTWVPSSVHFSHLVMSDSLQPHGLQHARPPCPSPTPGACSNSSPLSQWCHPTISSSVAPFSSCPQSSQRQGLFQCQLFASGGQSIGVSASASALSMNIQDWFPLGLTDWISLLSKGLSIIFSNTSILQCSAFFMVQLSFPYVTTGKAIALTIRIFVGKVMFLLFHMVSVFVTAFLPRSRCLLIAFYIV